MSTNDQPNPDERREPSERDQSGMPAEDLVAEFPEHVGSDESALLPPGPIDPRPAHHRDWDKVRATRTGRAWTGLIIGAIILVLLLVFIIQNLDSARLHLFVWEWDLPIGVAVLFSVIIGALLAGLIGGARILQLRRAAKKP